MYISDICSENIGPLEKVVINPGLTKEGFPKPIVIVGENGSGKSTLISNIVDAFYELANVGFSDAMHTNRNYQGKQYFKAITQSEMHIGRSYMFSHIGFANGDKVIHYSFVGGKISLDEYKKRAGIEPSITVPWSEETFHKSVTIDKKDSESIFTNNVLCYFGPERYEKPVWMGKSYYDTSMEESQHPSVANRYNGEIANSIEEKERNARTLQWLLDVIADSRPDIQFAYEGIEIIHVGTDDLNLLGIARKNVETIMSEILGKEVFFGLNFRSQIGSRFNIRETQSGQIIIPTLDSLSTGQSALFNLFATIVRYADKVDINKSIHLNDISGIVVIDEVDLHLHSSLQKEVLPKLFKLFPKVQFIISTHSPLFILGMKEIYGEENCAIYEMPTGKEITAEAFSEFHKAYRYMIETETHKKEIEKLLASTTEVPSILTEGATDWRHIKAAWEHFKDREEYQGITFKLIKYDSVEGTALPKIEMSSSEIVSICKQLSKLPRTNKVIMIADADVPNDAKQLKEAGKNYRAWGNNIFSIVLPLPKHRDTTPSICIEHYYTDEEIRTPIQISGIEKRLYLGNEFDENGLSISDAPRLLCLDRNSCGEGKINIIDGQEKKSVVDATIPKDKRVNLALTKMAFANAVLNPPSEEFKLFDFSAFKILFDVIKEILLLSE